MDPSLVRLVISLLLPGICGPQASNRPYSPLTIDNYIIIVGENQEPAGKMTGVARYRHLHFDADYGIKLSSKGGK